MTGIGGDCFCLLAKKGTAPVIAYNGSGRAPAAATPARFRNWASPPSIRSGPMP